MKRIVSVSIGSSKRNHRVQMDILGERFVIERIGTDGDMTRAAQLIEELDGHVDCFGLGGIDLYIMVGERRYYFRDGIKLGRHAIKTPIVDGTGLKNSLERRVVHHVDKALGYKLEGRKVLLVSAADRFGMAEAFKECNADTIFGDLIFTLGLPIPIRGITTLKGLAMAIAPILCTLPFEVVYPTGKTQGKANPKPTYSKYYQWADVIAGDWHFIHKYMPEDMTGKVVLTNTVTPTDVEECRNRGVSKLITTTPDLNGRSFGTNVMEAVVIAVAGKRPSEMTGEDYDYWLDQIGFRPRVEDFGAMRSA